LGGAIVDGSVKPALHDRGQAAGAQGLEVKGLLRLRLEQLRAIDLAPPHDPEHGAEALLGMGFGIPDLNPSESAALLGGIGEANISGG
jgi:hypothetical protein